MFRWTLAALVLAAVLWFVGFYRIAHKPVWAHVRDFYASSGLQSKLRSFGNDKPKKSPSRGKERAANESRLEPRRSESVKAREPTHDNPREGTREAATDAGQVQARDLAKKPAQDALTDQDREGLNHLLAEKLHAR